MGMAAALSTCSPCVLLWLFLQRVREVPGPAGGLWRARSRRLGTASASSEMGWWLTGGTECCHKGGRQQGAARAPWQPQHQTGTCPMPSDSGQGQVPLPWPAGVLPCSHPGPGEQEQPPSSLGRAVGTGISTPALEHPLEHVASWHQP